MKIAVMTWFHYHNYGTALQVTALNSYLKKKGHEPFVINYRPSATPVVLDSRNSFRYCFDKGISRLTGHFNRTLYTPEREKKFDMFLSENLQFTEECAILSDFEKLNNQYDAFICGSDQIWAPSVFDPHYFLDFVRNPNKMIAYAPSVGLPLIEDSNIKNRIRELTQRFVHISTREASGSAIISELIDRDVPNVLDPTFLLKREDWEKHIDNTASCENPYLLVYMLGKNKKHWKAIYGIARRLKLEVRIIPVFSKDLSRNDCINEVVGVEDFLKLVRDAAYVCTDSFHGLAFSIIFGKKFTIFERFKESDRLNQNSRIFNILNALGLNNRLWDDKRGMNSVSDEIDYCSVNCKLEEKRKQSEEYLINALIDVSEKSAEPIKKNIQMLSSLCCGCGACEMVCPTNAIHVQLSNQGFYQAVFDNDKCISCQKCLKSCPFINDNDSQAIRSAKIYSYIDGEPDTLSHSSSGGMAFRIAKQGLEQGYTVIGCEFDSANHIARHIVLNPENKNELIRLQGSKYMQSIFAPVISRINDKTIVFGTPCQIAGAKLCSKEEKDVLYVDLICHGVPSINLYNSYLRYLENHFEINTKGSISTIFRYKPRGWREIYLYNTDSEKEYCVSQKEDPYFLAFEYGFCYAKSCFDCPWRDKSAADIRLGDYWHEKYADNNTGVSMVLVLTEAGERIVHALAEKGSGVIKEEPIEDYFSCQQTKNVARPVFWEEFIQELSSEKDLGAIVKEYIGPFAKRKSISRKIQRIKRVIKKDGNVKKI